MTLVFDGFVSQPITLHRGINQGYPLSGILFQFYNTGLIDGYDPKKGETAKQNIVALSTTEAEYMSVTHATKEALWLHTFLTEIARPLYHPTILFCDNQSGIAIMKDDQYHACTKHIILFATVSAAVTSPSYTHCRKRGRHFHEAARLSQSRATRILKGLRSP